MAVTKQMEKGQEPVTDQDKEKTPGMTLDTSEKTTGEKYYSWLKFGVAEVFILVATAVIAYWARHGQDKWYNVFKQIQKLSDKVFSPLSRIGKDGSKAREVGTVLSVAAASTMVTFHGGNAFAPAMKWFDNKKNDIVNAFNKLFGKPDELEIGQERLKEDPKQSWGDVIKGRLAAWAIVFTSFVSATLLIGKSTKNNDYHFNNFEEWFARKFAGLTKGGKELAKISALQKLPEHLKENKSYRFGKILALDIYATTAAIIIWNVISELSAKIRQKEKKEVPHETPAPALPETLTQEIPERQFTDTVQPRERIATKTPALSQADKLATQRQNEPVQVGV